MLTTLRVPHGFDFRSGTQDEPIINIPIRSAPALRLRDATNFQGVKYCHPNYKKIEEIVANPGEILIFVKKLSWLERLSLH
jgi:hypothetical protein